VGSENPMAFHCIIHQRAECGKMVSLEMKQVRDILIMAANFIRRTDLNRPQFQSVLEKD
jgi:hypothetical protein